MTIYSREDSKSANDRSRASQITANCKSLAANTESTRQAPANPFDVNGLLLTRDARASLRRYYTPGTEMERERWLTLTPHGSSLIILPPVG